MAILLGACKPLPETPSRIQKLSIADNGHYFQNENGDPFFWLGDTGWLLLKKLNREDAAYYLENRARKGFNVIQVMVIHDLKNCTNYYGDSAVMMNDISRPLVTGGNDPEDEEAYDYWDHLDYVVDLAAGYGLYMALVPIWGSNVKSNPVTPEQATSYGTWLADRYRDRNNVIWLNGGDILGSDSTAFWDALGHALKSTAPGHLVTFHPFGRTQSSTWFNRATWLDFNMFQSGHRRYDQDDTELGYGEDNWRYVQSDYRLMPVRPTLDGEPSYENIPEGLHDTTQPLWDDADVRRYAYWSVFSGACGFTYGHREVMQFFRPGTDNPAYGATLPWKEALEAPGASQLIHLKNLMDSIPLFQLVPDQSLVAGAQGDKYEYIAACRGDHFAFLYTYTGRVIDVAMGKIGGREVNAAWYDPRTGNFIEDGRYENTGTRVFDPPGDSEEGNDWVLVLRSLK
ncbi:MAG: glycoside hydrolase family 140 protein [Bacteroidales bacterium]